MELDSIGVFVHVVRAGSFAEAARRLGMPKSTVSLRVAELERRLAVSLLKRTTRRLHLTEAGGAYFAACEQALAQIEAADEVARSGQERPRGLLRISAAPGMGTGGIGDAIASFLREHAEISVDLQLTSRRVDLAAENVDLAIRAGRLEDSTLKARRLWSGVFRLYASPAYLQGRPAPQHPRDLKQHACLCFTTSAEKGQTFDLRCAGKRVRVAASGRFSSNQIDAVRHQALRGQGVAFLPEEACARELERGGLSAVLPEWSSAPVHVYLVYPDQRFLPAKVKAFVEHVMQSWARSLAG